MSQSPPSRNIFGRRSNVSDADVSGAASSSSAVVAGSLRAAEIAPPTPPLAPSQPPAAVPTSAATAALLTEKDEAQRQHLLLQQQQQQQALDQQQQQRLEQLQEMHRLAQPLSPQDLASPSASSPHAPQPDPSSVPAPPPAPVGVPSADPDGADHSVDPNAPAVSPDGLRWLQKSSLQQSPVTVYYSKDPISNLQLRVLLRRQPDDASANSLPKTRKQLNLAMKEKEKKEEREREALARSVAGHTSAAALQGRADDDGATEEKRDAEGRLALSPHTEEAAAFKASVVATQLFSWQQKVCSPAEILLAAHSHKSANSYVDQVSHVLKERFPHDDAVAAAQMLIAGQREGMMLSSKRDHDRYIDPDELNKHVTTSRSDVLNPLAERITMAPLVSKRNESHLTREADVTPFYILATVDLPSEAGKVRLVHASANDYDAHPPSVHGAFQKPLASIKVREGDEYTTLEMRPPFSPPQKNPADFDDLEWYSFYTPAGEHFRYRIENYSGVLDSEDDADAAAAGGRSRALIALERNQVEAAVARMQAHEMQVAMNRSGRDFDRGPLVGFESWHVLGELTKTSGFQEETISLAYEIDLRRREHDFAPDDVWTCLTTDRLEAVTQTSTALLADPAIAGDAKVRECYFSFPFEVKLSKREATPALGPVLYLSVYSTNVWGMSCVVGYGFVHVPLDAGCHELEVDTWVPLGTLSDQKTKFFVGAGPTLRDVKLCGVPHEQVRCVRELAMVRWTEALTAMLTRALCSLLPLLFPLAQNVLNRYGWQSIARGKVHVRFEVVHLRPATAAPVAPSTAHHTSAALDALRSQYLRSGSVTPPNARVPGSPFSPSSSQRGTLIQRRR